MAIHIVELPGFVTGEAGVEPRRMSSVREALEIWGEIRQIGLGHSPVRHLCAQGASVWMTPFDDGESEGVQVVCRLLLVGSVPFILINQNRGPNTVRCRESVSEWV